MILLEAVFWILFLAGCLYWILVAWSTLHFFQVRQSTGTNEMPPVSILKPVKGVDADAYENFASFCRQRYPQYEIVFGVADRADPAVELVGQLQNDFPDRQISLVFAPPRGTNPKSSILDELSRRADYELLVISDSDIRVAPQYLCEVVAPLADPDVGLVTCPYGTSASSTLASRLESLYLNAAFVPVCIASHELLGVCFAFGATVAVRRSDLKRAGGYAAIADYLADDYYIADRVARLGRRIILSRHVVTNVLGETTFGELWDREVRWSRTIRALRPWQYPGLLITFTTPWALALVAASGGSLAALVALGVALVLRWSFCCRMLRCLGLSPGIGVVGWLPLRDLLTPLVWCAGLVGRRVKWRGTWYELLPDNRLRPRAAHRSAPARLATAAVVWLDARLRRQQGIFEYSSRADCLFRLSIERAADARQLEDGTEIERGDCVAELHFWNQHMPPMARDGADLRWGTRFRQGLEQSLEELARTVGRDARLRSVKAFRGSIPITSRSRTRVIERMGKYLHLEVQPSPPPRGLMRRLHAAGNDVLLWALVRTFNPGGSKRLRLCQPRHEVWLSRSRLLENFGKGMPRGDSDARRCAAEGQLHEGTPFANPN